VEKASGTPSVCNQESNLSDVGIARDTVKAKVSARALFRTARGSSQATE
jgi:hypothetical protein